MNYLTSSLLETETTVNPKVERLIAIRQAFKLKPKQFSDALNENSSNYYQIESGSRSLGKTKSNELFYRINELPREITDGRTISKLWWETGEGPMFDIVSPPRTAPGIRQQDIIIPPLVKDSSSARYVGPYADSLIEIPFVNRAATASFIEVFTSDCAHDWREEMFRYFQDHSSNLKITARHMAFEVVGDSMEPTLNDGSCILAERINTSFDSLESGVYVILYDSKLVVKRIINNEILSHGFLTLHSDNPRHGSQPVKVDDLRCGWRVLEVIRQKVK